MIEGRADARDRAAPLLGVLRGPRAGTSAGCCECSALVPRVPASAAGRRDAAAMATRRFTHWSFDHYLNDRAPELRRARRGARRHRGARCAAPSEAPMHGLAFGCLSGGQPSLAAKCRQADRGGSNEHHRQDHRTTKKAAGDLTGDASLRRQGARGGAQGRGEGPARRRPGPAAGEGPARSRTSSARPEGELAGGSGGARAAEYRAAASPQVLITKTVPAEQQQDADHASQRDRRLSRPRTPSRSITTAVVSWPATVAAVTPPAPSVRT